MLTWQKPLTWVEEAVNETASPHPKDLKLWQFNTNPHQTFRAEPMTYDFAIVGAGLSAWRPPAKFCGHGLVPRSLFWKKKPPLPAIKPGTTAASSMRAFIMRRKFEGQFCREGASATKAFCVEHDIKFENCGKLLVATNDRERVHMEALFERAKQNGIAPNGSITPALCSSNPMSLASPLCSSLRRDRRLQNDLRGICQNRLSRGTRSSSAPKSLPFTKTRTPSKFRPPNGAGARGP